MPDRTENLLIFTDLDGTLLDHFSYDYTEALPAIAQLEQRQIPGLSTVVKHLPKLSNYARHSVINTHLLQKMGRSFISPAYSISAGTTSV